ncbi:MAG: ribbon-helix-helix protein, CopG family [Nitrospirae bacterium]|nr:ribbon-helix-helix protein, CopG family [Nitrospirota bacterium]
MKIPKFKTIEEERAFWDKHSVADYLSELEETKDLVFERPALKRNFQVRLDNDTIRKLKKLAGKKGTDMSTLIRQWIGEHLDKELKAA